MKLGEKFIFEGGKVQHIEKWDAGQAVRDAEKMRGVKDFTGGKLLNFVGGEVCEPQYSYPIWVEQMWATKWGVKQSDPAFESIIQLELNSGEWERFRI